MGLVAPQHMQSSQSSDRTHVSYIGTLGGGFFTTESPGKPHSSFFFFMFWLHHAACGILVPQPGIEPTPPALEAWTVREVPVFHILVLK